MSEPVSRPILPKGWARARGFSYAVVSSGGQTVRVAGQVAQTDGGDVPEGLDMGQQFERALGNVATVVKTAGGLPEHIAMLRVYVTDVDAFKAAGAAIGAGWRMHLGKHFPAMTLVEVTRLFDPRAVVEIEGEAVIPG